MQTRVAPTPSGFLHVGNAANALVTSAWAMDDGLELRLRIDDLDDARARPEYIEDILKLLDWLGIRWTHGPRTVVECQEARAARSTRAWDVLEQALQAGMPAYACNCSRRTLAATPTHGCPGDCRAADRPLDVGESALRIHVPPGTTIDVQGEAVELDLVLGDFIVWRRDDRPAYQWFSVVEDTDHGTTHILRGEDLRVSTAAQLYLAGFLPDAGFLEADIRHHPLVLDDAGLKLSKSQLRRASGLPRSPQTREAIRRWAVELGGAVGVKVP